MGDNAYAVLIGLNTYADTQWLSSLQYAEKDCKDLCDALTDQQFGLFHSENVNILLGRDATTRRVEHVLYTEVVKDRRSADIVLVYFSGHGFLGEDERAYLATYDVSVNELLLNPNAGLRMSFVHDDIFRASKAEQVIFILDCCHAGALIPPASRASLKSATRGLIDEHFYAAGKGRVAIVACPPEAFARESAVLENGFLTHYLVKGLRGEGGTVDADSGVVTLDRLLDYAKKHIPPEQPTGRYGVDYGRIVLTKPSPTWQRHKAQHSLIKLDLAKPIQNESQEALNVAPLRHPLAPYDSFRHGLVTILGDESLASGPAEFRLLEGIRRASSADFVFRLEGEGSNWLPTARSHLDRQGTSVADYIESVVSRFLPIVLKEALGGTTTLSPAHHGMCRVYREDATGTSKVIVLVPLRPWPAQSFLVVCGLPTDSTLLGDAYGCILAAADAASHTLRLMQTSALEAAILDDLKQTYGFLPLTTYTHRFELFRQRLTKMVIHFEPVLYLGPREPYIESWEALARDPDSLLAPNDLFRAAELWGPQFMIELDQHFVMLATNSYREALSRSSDHRRGGNIPELSVNVYPESLMRSAYFETVNKISADEIIPPHKLLLEISEKTPIPQLESGIADKSSETFKAQLGRYVSQTRIGFAIDDFGVGHASLSRLATLHPTVVKVDRDLLHVELAEDTIHFALSLIRTLGARLGLHGTRVVIEGFDGTSPITLDRLYHLGVRHVQGYMVGKAGPELNRLDRELKERFVRLLRPPSAQIAPQ